MTSGLLQQMVHETMLTHSLKRHPILMKKYTLRIQILLVNKLFLDVLVWNMIDYLH